MSTEKPLSHQLAEFLKAKLNDADPTRFETFDEEYYYHTMHWAKAEIAFIDFTNDQVVIQITLDPRTTSKPEHKYIVRIEPSESR